MTNPQSPTNWDRELTYISREFDGLPAAPVSTLDSARKAAEKHAREQRAIKTARFGVCVRAALVTALAVGMFFWPYAKSCGAGLFGFMGAAVVIGAAAVWVVTLSWTHRMPRAHALGFLLVLASLVLLGTEVLPRVGYAKTNPANPPRWICQ
jgi:hypothetical protein